MSGRSIAVAAILAGASLLGWGVRAERPPPPIAVVSAPPCHFPVEAAAGIDCWDGRPRPAGGVRPGDRVDGSDHPQGRMSPAALRLWNVPIDPNRADADELTALPGIGPALAHRIVAERERGGPFRDADELARVSGIGEKTVEKLRSRLAFAPR